MTPEELEALADRVEQEANIPVYKRGGLERLVFSALGTHVFEKRGSDRKEWWYPVNNKGPRRADDRSMFGIPRFLDDLNAAASVMPAGWVVTVTRWPSGKSWVDAAECSPKMDGFIYANECPKITGQATTECAARVAAGLRARAHVLRSGGAA